MPDLTPVQETADKALRDAIAAAKTGSMEDTVLLTDLAEAAILSANREQS